MDLRSIAESGDLQAQVELGFAAYPSAASPKDFRESLRWFRRAAEGGHPVAQKQLGWMHYEGEGVLRDEEQALEWYHLASDQGDAEAQRAVEVLTRSLREREVAAREAEAVDSMARPVAEEQEVEPDALTAPNAPFEEMPPVVVFNEHNQYVTYENRPEPDRNRQLVNYLAAAGFFARAREDAAIREFRDRVRSKSRSPQTRTVSTPGILGGSITRGVTPMTRGVTPLTRGIEPLGGWQAVTNHPFGRSSRRR